MEDEWEKELARFDDETLDITPIVWDDQEDMQTPMEEVAVPAENGDEQHAMCEENNVETPQDIPVVTTQKTEPQVEKIVSHETPTTPRGTTSTKTPKRSPARIAMPIKKPSNARQIPPPKKSLAAGRRGPRGKRPSMVPDV